MKFWHVAAAALLAVAGRVESKSTFSPARPPAAPLAVRSPYLNVWLNGLTDGGESGVLPNQWPRFWTCREGIQGWQGYIKVDGKTYNWMGNHPSTDYANQTAQSYTSTKTTFVMDVGGQVELTISFLSPVFPKDQMRQSIPFAYMNVEVKSMDGCSHSVQIYSDVSGEFASGDNSALIEWEHQNVNDLHTHRFWRQNQDVFNEANDQASWGHWYWTTKDQSGVSYQIGQDTEVRSQFVNNGSLDGSIDSQFRALQAILTAYSRPVFALSRDLGKVNETVATLFTIGIAQDEAIQYHGVGDQKGLPSLWRVYYSNDSELVKFFYDDYDYSVEKCLELDRRIEDDSKSAAGQDYATITSLALRQLYGGLQFVGTRDNIKVFLKEISSNSDIQTVDVLFPAFPAMVYLNHDLIRWTLEPLLEYQKSGRYPNKWAVHDLGRYPRALGYDDGNDEPMPLEECGNMIIMMLSYAQKSGNNTYLADNWDLLTRWAEYLIEDAKIPAHQLSTDDFAGQLANQTNLAIKGIIALEAMSEVATRAGHADQKQHYSDIAHAYYGFWSEHGINHAAATPHATLAYDDMDSYGLLYNLWGDKVLGLGFVPAEVYAMQSAWYPQVANAYGMVLDTRGTLTKSDWQVFAASMADEPTKRQFVALMARWINETTTWRALTDLYDTKDGGYPRGIEFTARPVVGGLFAILALQ
ncbi:glutaminase GtaA [Cordyceps militaris CM01]|uniref:Glutaminase GtaA n=1 Tax=Cordyceps militaris (strain CM01) TaxID=983644 RepID=G3JRQ1_CORMM|nr:glutaminase GtaA [Cordyceps militaris CM01]EGX88441.1 glutaminase GtaA [Cordyceps militaris CM01]